MKVSNAYLLKSSENKKRQWVLENQSGYTGKIPNNSLKRTANIWLRTVTAISATIVMKADTINSLSLVMMTKRKTFSGTVILLSYGSMPYSPTLAVLIARKVEVHLVLSSFSLKNNRRHL